MKIFLFSTIVLVTFEYLKVAASVPCNTIIKYKDFICHSGRHRSSVTNETCITVCTENGIPSCIEATVFLKGFHYHRDSSDANNDNETNVNTSLPNCGDGVIAVPSYILYIVGVLWLLMLVAIIWLGVLYRTQSMRKYKCFGSPNTQTVNTDIRRYMTQSSQEMSLLNINSKQESKQQTFKETNGKNDIFPNNGKDSDFIESKPHSQSALKIYKSVRKPVDHQVLLREQMKKICEDALAKSHNSDITASLKDLNQLLSHIDHDKKEKLHENIVREKSASFPQLDIYDAPPARHIPVNENEMFAPVYESLPTSNNIVVEDYDTMYLMTLSKENLKEPSYINAKNRYN